MTGKSIDILARDRPAGIPAHIGWALAVIGLPMAVAGYEGVSPVISVHDGYPANRLEIPKGLSKVQPPPVEPVELLALDRDSARRINAATPFSSAPNPSARPFNFAGGEFARERAIDCLAAAQWYEAGDDATGERAVAQVVLNRLRHPAFPKTVCDVVFQGAERSTGCQFTFTCDGALARTPPAAAWERARQIARAALSGAVYRPVGYATHYHTDWVVPYWSASLEKISAVGSHLFFRWAGWWGTPPAFRRAVDSSEPIIPQIARLSSAHASPVETLPSGLVDPTMSAAAALAAAPQQAIGAAEVGKRFGESRLAAIDADGTSFAVTLPRNAQSDAMPSLARIFCAGRSKCRILAWRDPNRVAKTFPVDWTLLADMSFSYIQLAERGFARSLWNCAQFPRANPAECMRMRIPAPMARAITPAPSLPEGAPIERTLPPVLTGVRRGRFEQVTISPAPAQAPSRTEQPAP
ncbi:cell wall hydrolase [Sphingobium sp. H39-3-25]|uniref:cell wall hydrolase n=1 Tax=Sphingobium arseniciresistens TaxID=3030834 RepID=UPI0023B99F41|nr:cell wall hydrolase [Sphingobium arseniciresistens]